MNSMRTRIFSRIARFSFFHRRCLILGALILGAMAGFLITRLQFQSDVLNLLPEKAPRTQAFVKFLKEFGSGDSLFIVLERKSGGEVESLIPFAEVLVDRLMATGEFTEIIGRMEPEVKEKMALHFLRRALLYLPEEDLKMVESKLSDQGVEEQIRLLKTRLSSMFTSPLAAYDPLELLPLFQKNLPLPPSLADSDSQGYLISADRKMMLLIAKPKGSAPDVDFDERLLRKVQDAESSARRDWARKEGPSAVSLLDDLKVGLTGGFIQALEDSRLIKKELLWNFSISLFSVLALIFISFQTRLILFYAFFPLLISPLITLGLFSPFLGRLSEATGAFSAIILGLSIDFIIILYSRYLEERHGGTDISGALEKSLVTTGPGILTGAVTTAAAYYALLISDFRGIRELGLLTGTGILVSLACAFFLFPALVTWREMKNPGRASGRRLVFSWGLERLSHFSRKQPLLILILAGALSLVSLPWALQVKMDNDPQRLRPENQSSLELQMRVQEKMDEGLETMILLASTRTVEESLEVQGTWRKTLETGISSGLLISRFECLAAFVPPLSQQKRNLEWMKSRGQEAFDPDRVTKRLQAVLRQEGFRPESFEPGMTALREMLASRELLSGDQIEASPLRTIADRFLKRQGDSFLSVAYVHLRPDFWLHPRAQGWVDSLEKSNFATTATSPKLVQQELERLMSQESWKILLLALAAVALLIYLDFRSWPLTAVSLLPVVLASLWTLGIMGALQVRLNFMNLIVFTMVLGIGVDYGVHVLHRGLQSSPENLGVELEKVNRGVVLAALTTLAGFGSLVTSSYPGLQSMGAVALMGVGFSLLFALTLVPILLHKWLGRG
jgi:predicted RND superfamily exporter protein